MICGLTEMQKKVKVCAGCRPGVATQHADLQRDVTQYFIFLPLRSTSKHTDGTDSPGVDLCCV